MGLAVPLFGADCAAPALTDTFGRLLTCLVPPAKNYFTRLLSILYTVSTTAHTLTVLREKGRTTVSSAALAAQAVVNLTADPGALPLGPGGSTSHQAADPVAANDWLVFELPDGSFWFEQVTSVASLAITMNSNVPTGGINAGAVCWFLGTAGDSNPLDPIGYVSKGATPASVASAHPVFDAFAVGSGTGQVNIGGIQSEDIAGLCKSPKTYSPMLIQSNNATVAGTIEHYTWGYSDR